MTTKDPAVPGSKQPGFKQKAKHELKDFAVIATYLAFFFCALSTYTMLLLRKYHVSYLNYALSIINALVIAKVILIGEMMHVGRKAEARPLYQSVFYKAFMFGLLVFAFHILEEFVKRLIHGDPFGTVWRELDLNDLVARSIVIFCTFIPLFAFTELRRVLGEDKLYALFRNPAPAEKPGVAGRAAEV